VLEAILWIWIFGKRVPAIVCSTVHLKAIFEEKRSELLSLIPLAEHSGWSAAAKYNVDCALIHIVSSTTSLSEQKRVLM
jgi:hypothetical protein